MHVHGCTLMINNSSNIYRIKYEIQKGCFNYTPTKILGLSNLLWMWNKSLTIVNIIGQNKNHCFSIDFPDYWWSFPLLLNITIGFSYAFWVNYHFPISLHLFYLLRVFYTFWTVIPCLLYILQVKLHTTTFKWFNQY